MEVIDDDKITIEEAYQSAITTSNLRVEADRKGAGDILIAAGWSTMRIGGLLMRLHSSWDSAEKPSRVAPGTIAQLVGTYQRPLEGANPEPEMDKDGKRIRPKPLTHQQAHEYAHAWHAREVGALLGKLKEFPDARDQATIQGAKWGWDDATAKAPAILRYWLDQQCPSCHGTKWQVVQGTNRHGSKPCSTCRGAGVTQAPYEEQGKRMCNWFDTCVEKARGSIRKNLSAYRISRQEAAALAQQPHSHTIAVADGRKC